MTVLSLGALLWATGQVSPAGARGASPPVVFERHARGSACLYSVMGMVKDEPARYQGKLLERSTELELDLRYVLPHLTTEDGTLQPLALDVEGRQYQALFGKRDPATIRWDGLSDERKRQVLDEAEARALGSSRASYPGGGSAR